MAVSYSKEGALGGVWLQFLQYQKVWKRLAFHGGAMVDFYHNLKEVFHGRQRRYSRC